MAVTIGSARSDERGKITGGKAGDQNKGREVSTQSWYRHGKGWRVFRCKIPEMRPLLAEGMYDACTNDNIGYDQYQRTTLTKYLEAAKWLLRNVKTKCETDCSKLVIDIINCALKRLGRSEVIPNANTATLPKVLPASDLFEELKGSKYTDDDDYLMAGDILVTRTKGHVVICITSGSKADSVPDARCNLGDRILKKGMEGDDVKELQSLLIQLGYDLGKWGADGDFGDATEIAVRYLQRVSGIDIDGEVGPQTLAALETKLKIEDGDGVPVGARYVIIENGNCYVRTEPKVAKGNDIGVAYERQKLKYLGETSLEGWNKVEFKEQVGWVSGKYSRLEA